jgi:perosamine synthetase
MPAWYSLLSDEVGDRMERFIPVYEPDLSGNELRYVTDCVRTSWISSIGEYVRRFEQGFARFCGARYGVATSNGTTALHLALVTLGIGAGDEVIVPALTFIATANAITYTGARPVLVDSEAQTWNLDPARLEESITPRTKAIIPVHVYGHPVDMDPLLEIARRYGLYVIEDAAEAHGAEYKERRVGALGDIGCFSFYGNKIITTGEGGMVVTNDEQLAERAAMLRDHAMSPERRYWHFEVGYNYRLTNLQAAVGVAQMERIHELIAVKRRNAHYYNALLREVRGVTLPPEEPWAKNVYWMYSILVEDSFAVGRGELAAHLKERGIDSRPFFHPLHTMPPYRQDVSLPVAESLARKGLNLPSSALLQERDIERIVGAIKELATPR